MSFSQNVILLANVVKFLLVHGQSLHKNVVFDRHTKQLPKYQKSVKDDTLTYHLNRNQIKSILNNG